MSASRRTDHPPPPRSGRRCASCTARCAATTATCRASTRWRRCPGCSTGCSHRAASPATTNSACAQRSRTPRHGSRATTAPSTATLTATTSCAPPTGSSGPTSRTRAAGPSPGTWRASPGETPNTAPPRSPRTGTRPRSSRSCERGRSRWRSGCSCSRSASRSAAGATRAASGACATPTPSPPHAGAGPRATLAGLPRNEAHLAEPVLRTEPPAAGPPLRGRAAELTALDDALDAIGQGRSRFVFFGGEPGIGKSRLLEELSQRAESRGHQVLAGRGGGFERDVPFAVWVDALDGYLGSLDAGRLRKMGVSDREELAAIFPSLGEPAPAAMEDDRHRAHRAVHELLEGLAAARPLVIELDDLHWADAASLELIATLARRPPERGVLVAGAHRPTDSLEALLATLER